MDAAFNRLFDELSALGEFRISRREDGNWHAAVKFPAPEGVTAECRSDFKHPTAVEALQCLHDRLGGLRSMISVETPVPSMSHLTIVAGAQ